MKIKELYEKVTQDIIADLEQGVASWVKPWNIGVPTNVISNKPYSGINIPLLWQSAKANSFTTQRWLTYKQAREKGTHVKKGAKGTQIVFTKKVVVGEEDDEKLISMLRAYTVFNACQVEGLEAPTAPVRPLEGAESFIRATKAHIVEGVHAAYTPALDRITMPPIATFEDQGSYYSTALHELGHWSGHESRLDRQLKGRFDEQAYAAEELIAELTAAFLCAHLCIQGELRHSEYIGSWIKLLKNDPKAIITASSHASKAADFLRSFQVQS